MRVVKWFFMALGLVLIILVVMGIGARFGDGPTAMFPGGPLEAGEMVTGPEPDWTFAADIPTLEFQLVEPSHSRTTWLQVHDEKLYIVSAYMNTPVGAIWKQWPAQAIQDGRAVIRVDGKRYERQLDRVLDDPELLEVIASEIQRKYGEPITADSAVSGDTWVFSVGPRSAP